ncbi:ATP-grasp domain-containing protein [Streptomyces tagetis]
MPLLLAALNETGVAAESAEWDDPAVDWAGFDLVLIRSTWDYTWRTEAFLEWVERCSRLTTLLNPPPVVRWSSDKFYLSRLTEAHVPAVPTRYLAPGAAVEAAAVLPSDHEYVIKPAVGAGARYAARYRAGDRDTAVRHIGHMHAEGITAMVQPYMARIETGGERALVFFGGSFLHAIRKKAVLGADVPFDQRKVAHPGLEPWVPTAREREVAESALAVVPHSGELFYARVDLVDDDEGRPVVMELELIEPNLFLSVQPASLPVVTGAIAARARDARRLPGQPVAEHI